MILSPSLQLTIRSFQIMIHECDVMCLAFFFSISQVWSVDTNSACSAGEIT